jgi:hypothetical protein
MPATAETKPVRLFISYAREDREQVEQLASALEKAGFSVWWDVALEGGHQFAAEIERQLERADAVVVLWSAASVRSNWVLDEAMHGRDRGCLIPVRFDDTPPPLGFRQIQSIDLDGGDSAGEVEAIQRAVARLRGFPPVEPGAYPRSGAKAGKPNKEKKGDGKPIWYPFAWVAVGVLIWLISKGMGNG